MLQRFWRYLRDCFSPLSQGVLITVITLCGVSFSMLARYSVGQTGQPDTLSALHWGGTLLVAFVSVLGFFIQLRVATEARDATPKLFHSNQRALRDQFTLRGLTLLVGVTMFVQLGLAFWLQIELIQPLLLIWGYLWLIHKRFFIYHWLKVHPLAQLLSQTMVTPLIFWYITACDWLVVGAAPPAGLLWFLVSGFFSGMIFEIGCNIRAPQDEEAGVETYSKLWGRRTAVTTWLLAIALTGISLTIAAEPVRTSIIILALAIGLLTSGVLIGERFLQMPLTRYAGSIQKFSTLCMVLLYLGLAIMPLFFI